jgi:hypothetical protein
MRPLPINWKLCVLFAAAWPRVIAASSSALEITIHVYDYARVEPPQMVEAEALAARVLGQAGIETRWRHCTMPTLGLAAELDCAEAGNGMTHLIVRILPERMSRKIASRSQQFGTSISTRAGVFSTDAYVFFERVVDLAGGGRSPWRALLGAAIAHEVGHLLLGDNSHHAVGIMRARWGREEIKQILMGVLTFTPRQAERMRADVGRRMNRMN